MLKFKPLHIKTNLVFMEIFDYFPETQKHGFSLATVANSMPSSMSRREYLQITDMGSLDGSLATS